MKSGRLRAAACMMGGLVMLFSGAASAVTFNYTALVTKTVSSSIPTPNNLDVMGIIPGVTIITGQVSYDASQSPFSSVVDSAIYLNVSFTANIPAGLFSISPSSLNYDLGGAPIVVENDRPPPANDSIIFQPQTFLNQISPTEFRQTAFHMEISLERASASLFSNTNLPSTLFLADFPLAKFLIYDTLFVRDLVNDTITIETTNRIEGELISFEATPLPAALPLFATGLGALGLLGWRRKRKAIA